MTTFDSGPAIAMRNSAFGLGGLRISVLLPVVNSLIRRIDKPKCLATTEWHSSWISIDENNPIVEVMPIYQYVAEDNPLH
jgi:hypothetical protein